MRSLDPGFEQLDGQAAVVRGVMQEAGHEERVAPNFEEQRLSGIRGDVGGEEELRVFGEGLPVDHFAVEQKANLDFLVAALR